MLDLNELRQEQTRLESQGNDSFLNNFARMPEGEGVVVVRILPPRKGQKLFCVTRTHKLGQKNFHCPQSLVNGKWQGVCPICNYYKRLWQESDAKGGSEAEALQAEARSIKPLERYYYNVIIRSQINKDTGELEKDVGPKILSIGKKLHAKIIRAILGDPALEEPGLGDVTDYESGYDFKIIKRISKSGGDSFPNYDESKFLERTTPTGNAKQVAQWKESLHDLQALRILKTAEELSTELNIFRGLEKDPNLEFDFRQEKIEQKKPTHVPPKTNRMDDDESLVEEDFLSDLRNM